MDTIQARTVWNLVEAPQHRLTSTFVVCWRCHVGYINLMHEMQFVHTYS